MFGHVGVVFRDLGRSGDLCPRLLEPLGIRQMEDHTQNDGTGWLVFGYFDGNNVEAGVHG